MGGVYRGTATAIGRLVQRDRSRFDWMRLSDESTGEPPLTTEEALELVGVLRTIDPEQASELRRPTVDLEDVPTPEQLASFIRAEQEASRQSEVFTRLRTEAKYSPCHESSAERRTRIKDLLEEFNERRKRLEARPEVWVRQALGDVLAGRESAWRLMAKRTREGLRGLQNQAGDADTHNVVLPEEYEIRTVLDDARHVRRYLLDGGRWSIVGVPRREVRGRMYLRKGVKVDGKPADSPRILAKLISYLEVLIRLDGLWAIWKGNAEPRSTRYETQVAELEEHLEALEGIFGLLDLTGTLSTILTDPPRIPRPDWSSNDPAVLVQVIAAVEAAENERRARGAADSALERLDEVCADHEAHLINRSLKDALVNRDQEAWSQQFKLLKDFHSRREILQGAEVLLQRLRTTVPELAAGLSRSPSDPAWDQRFADFEGAWAWARAENWLSQHGDEERLLELVDENHRLDRRIGRLVAQVAAERAWCEFLYDHANIRYSGKIILREHFRCVPEIIQFSNDLCYAPNGTPLIPLRAYPPKRLRPVVTRWVNEGYQEGRASAVYNRPEPVSVATQIAACIDDPRYNGKTFGVITLLGNRQARIIQHFLAQLIGPEEMEERELVRGDAYAFQGDERDVMFLSMVSAPNARIGAMTKLSAHQRFNVAASRAKDQLWLFHSVKPEDLSAECVRRRLLEYCLNPSRAPLETSGEELNKFESDVYELISARGYCVLTQVPAGDQTSHRYRIDLVVEGMKGRLAVECDGDRWHGPESYERDMARQRIFIETRKGHWRLFGMNWTSSVSIQGGVATTWMTNRLPLLPSESLLMRYLDTRSQEMLTWRMKGLPKCRKAKNGHSRALRM